MFLFVSRHRGRCAHLQSVIDQRQDVLDRLLLGDVGHQVQKGLRTLSKTEKQNGKNTKSDATQREIEKPESKSGNVISK